MITYLSVITFINKIIIRWGGSDTGFDDEAFKSLSDVINSNVL
jgi:hypothetical protein